MLRLIKRPSVERQLQSRINAAVKASSIPTAGKLESVNVESGFKRSLMTQVTPVRQRLEIGRNARMLRPLTSKRNIQMKMNPNQGEPEKPALEQFGTNLTKLAKEGKLDPVIGRDEEIARAIQIL